MLQHHSVTWLRGCGRQPPNVLHAALNIDPSLMSLLSQVVSFSARMAVSEHAHGDQRRQQRWRPQPQHESSRDVGAQLLRDQCRAVTVRPAVTPGAKL